MSKHPHCDLIKAWADGAEIQFKSEIYGDWYSVPNPDWSPSSEYRIKPETVKYRVALFHSGAPENSFYTNITEDKFKAEAWERMMGFVRWLTDWVEVEV